jgi:hypothetical protein
MSPNRLYLPRARSRRGPVAWAQLAAPVVPGGPSSTVGTYSNSWSPSSKVRLSTRILAPELRLAMRNPDALAMVGQSQAALRMLHFVSLLGEWPVLSGCARRGGWDPRDDCRTWIPRVERLTAEFLEG